MNRVDLNCDMGEMPDAISDGTQESLMPSLTSVNIACGGHAGDAQTSDGRHGVGVKRGQISFENERGLGRRKRERQERPDGIATRPRRSILSGCPRHG